MNNIDVEVSKRKGISKHALLMVLCCLIPLVILAVLWASGVSSNYLFFGIMLSCPLLHLVMMRSMNKGGSNTEKSGHGQNGGCH